MSKDSKKVLIIDDLDIRVEGMREALENQYKVFTSDNAKQAIEIFEKERPQICVIDMHLTPSYSCIDGVGLEVLEKIKNIDKTAECVMYKGLKTSDEAVEKAKRLGAQFFLEMPETVDHFMSIINLIAVRKGN